MRELDKILEVNERIIWESTPRFWPYFVSAVVPSTIFGILWLAFLTPFVAVNFFATGSGDAPAGFLIFWNAFLIPFLAVGLWALIGTPIYMWVLHKHLHYMITGKRVIIQSGVIGRDFKYIDFDQITNAEVRVGLWDKVLNQNSGSIIISSAGSFDYDRNSNKVSKPYTLSNIENPYEVFKMFKQVSHDVKTDIQYPNDLRPTNNSGYKTDYDPDK